MTNSRANNVAFRSEAVSFCGRVALRHVETRENGLNSSSNDAESPSDSATFSKTPSLSAKVARSEERLSIVTAVEAETAQPAAHDPFAERKATILAERKAASLVPATCLIVGIGSPHGDDQAGWQAIELLQAESWTKSDLRKAAVPHDLLDWLGGITELHIIDSCIGELNSLGAKRFALQKQPSSNASQWRWIPTEQEAKGNVTHLERPLNLRSAGSHKIDVLTVLELAACLDRLPEQVVLWAIPGHRYNASDTMSEDCQVAIQQCVTSIRQELYDA